MAGTKVFVSYSHEDAGQLAELWKFLAPFEREGRLDPWADTRLDGGDDWAAEIDAALDAAGAAVLLISQAFLASQFIAEREIPRLLARSAQGRLTILPIFLSPSTVEDTAAALTRFQGYGTPKKPLSEMSWSDQQREYAKLAKRLHTLAGMPGAAASTSFRQDALVRSPAAGPSSAGREHGLTVLLERGGDTLLVRRWVRGREIDPPDPLPWNDIRGPLEEAARVLDVGGEPGLRRWLATEGADCGQALGRVLLGGPERWGPLLQEVYGPARDVSQPTPVYAPVRLRIVTTDPLLAAEGPGDRLYAGTCRSARCGRLW